MLGRGALAALIWGWAALAGAEAPAQQATPAVERFQECAVCPEMVAVPGGRFVMGSPETEPERFDNEGPRRVVEVAPFAIGRFEVTFAEWDACAAAGGCALRPDDAGWGRGRRPVINITWFDAQTYLRWLNRQVGARVYRLPTEAEWAYAARAGTATPFWWGETISPAQANIRPPDAVGAPSGRTTEVGGYVANPFGLYDVHGNVWEWTADCWNPSFEGAPRDGSAWREGACAEAVLRGGAWWSAPRFARSAARDGFARDYPSRFVGFRVARTARGAE